MAIRNAPRRELRLNGIFAEQGLESARKVVLDRINAGERVEDIARFLAEVLGEDVSPTSIYDWIRRWRQETSQEVVPA